MKFEAPPGVWDKEPNYAKFTHAGLKCVVRRNSFGAWCGYVKLPPGKLLNAVKRIEQRREYNPLYKKFRGGIGYNAKVLRGVSVHGGLTYSGKLRRNTGGLERGLWVGFDCAHSCDFVPKMASFSFADQSQYRDMTFVIDETSSLAEQVKILTLG